MPNMKNRRLVWMYVCHERREYLSGHYMIPGNGDPIAPQSITQMLRPESAVGASLLALITPQSYVETGEPASHPLRGRWAGCNVIAVNNKATRPVYRKAETEYACINVEVIEYLRSAQPGWDEPLYEYVADDYDEIAQPRNIIDENK